MLDFKLQREEKRTVEPAKVHDVIILGGGPAGLAAGLYAARAGLDVLLIEKGSLGGQAAITDYIENCPGCLEGSGAEFIRYLEKQATKFGLKITNADVVDVDLAGEIKTIKTTRDPLKSRCTIIATGASPRKLDIPGEDAYQGRGVSHCATCDAPFYRDKVVAVVGGGDSAVQEGLFIARFAARVFIVHRRGELRATKIIQDKARANPKIEFRWNTGVEEIVGDRRATGLILRDLVTGEQSELPIDGVFVYIGLTPNTALLAGKVRMNPQGYIVTNERMETNVPGVYAIGDVRQTPLRQLVTAMADGAVAATYADRFISGESANHN
ncbi:MAG: thioredoxin-disulfide reductase [Chloroflexi bacterium]|nr:thioredoxin-disulfide reductase [Chloroflexota bacterium]